MFKSTIVFALCLAACFAYEVVEDQEGVQYYLVPIDHHRVRRQLSGGIGPNSATVSATGTLVNTPDHLLQGTGSATKHFGGPISRGGSLDYSHIPSGSGLSVGAQNTPRFGTDVGASGNYNFLTSKDGRTTAGASAYYNRHFGGLGGTGRPNYGAGLNFNHRF